MTRNYNTLIHQYKKAIVRKNKELLSKEYDSFSSFIFASDNSVVENLLKDYIRSKKTPGIGLKNNIIEDLKFLENEVIKPLGITMPKIEHKANSSLSSFFSFGKRNSSSEQMLNIRKSLMSYNEDSVVNESEILANIQNDTSYPLYIQFDFSNADEIKGLLTSYLLGKFTSNQISLFISKIISNYSDLVCTAYNTLKEIKELDIVKYALQNKLKRLRKINTDLGAEINDLKCFSETNKTIKDILIKQKNDVEIKYHDSVSQIINYRQEINVGFFNNLFFDIFLFQINRLCQINS